MLASYLMAISIISANYMLSDSPIRLLGDLSCFQMALSGSNKPKMLSDGPSRLSAGPVRPQVCLTVLPGDHISAIIL